MLIYNLSFVIRLLSILDMKLQSCTWHYKKRNSLLLRFHITITNRIWLHDCIWALESAYGRIKCAICNGRSDTATNPLYELDLLHLWSMRPNGQMAKQKPITLKMAYSMSTLDHSHLKIKGVYWRMWSFVNTLFPPPPVGDLFAMDWPIKAK